MWLSFCFVVAVGRSVASHKERRRPSFESHLLCSFRSAGVRAFPSVRNDTQTSHSCRIKAAVWVSSVYHVPAARWFRSSDMHEIRNFWFCQLRSQFCCNDTLQQLIFIRFCNYSAAFHSVTWSVCIRNDHFRKKWGQFATACGFPHCLFNTD